MFRPSRDLLIGFLLVSFDWQTSFYVLGLLVCLIQTAVFTILACVYIAIHTAEAEEGHH